MKKRFAVFLLSMAAALALTVTLSPRAFAQNEAQPEIYFKNIAYAVSVQTDGSQHVTTSMDVVLPEGSTGFAWKMHSDMQLNGYRIKDVTAGGSLAASVEENEYETVVTYGNGAASGAHRATLEYTVEAADDLDADRDVLRVACLGYGLEWDVNAMQVEIAYPPQFAYTAAEIAGAEYVAEQSSAFSIEHTEGLLQIHSTSTIPKYTGITVVAAYAQGTFAYPPLPAGPVLKQSDCKIEISPDMVYTVTQRLTLQMTKKDDWVALPILEFEDYTVKYTTEFLHSEQELKIQEQQNPWEPLYLYCTVGSAGEHVVEYTYTLRPARVNTPLRLVYRVPYWSNSVAQGSVSVTALGLQKPTAALRDALTQTPDERRFSVGQTGEGMTVALLRPLYAGESMLISAQLDPALFHRGATPSALGCVIFAAVVVLLALAGRLFFGRNRPIVPLPEATPPEAINCAEFGYLLDGVMTNSEMVALVLQWAAEGALRVEEAGGEYIFEKTGLPAGTDAYEQELFEEMFAHGHGNYVTTVQLRGTFAASVSKARTAALERHLHGHGLHRLGVVQWVCMAASLLCVVTMCLVGAAAQGDGAARGMMGAALCVLGQIVVTALCLFAFVPKAGIRRTKAGRKLRVACRILLCAVGAGFAAILCAMLPETAAWTVYAVVAMSTAACAVSAGFVRRSAGTYTLLCRVLGFACFLQSDSTEDFAANQKEDAAYYYKMLPYMLALNAQDAWQASFADIDVPAPAFWKDCPDRAAYTLRAQQMIEVLRRVSAPGGM